MKILNNRMGKVTVIVINEKVHSSKPRLMECIEPGKEIEVTFKVGDKIVLN